MGISRVLVWWGHSGKHESATCVATCRDTWLVACRGLETLVLLASWKLALPQQVFLLRGNHESATCTLAYGGCACVARCVGGLGLLRDGQHGPSERRRGRLAPGVQPAAAWLDLDSQPPRSPPSLPARPQASRVSSWPSTARATGG